MLILLQENLLQCYNAMQEIAMDGYRSQFDMVSSSDTPVNVLDQHFSSSESEKTNGTIETISTNSSNKIWAEKDIKRRKISAFWNNQTVQLSQMQQQCWCENLECFFFFFPLELAKSQVHLSVTLAAKNNKDENEGKGCKKRRLSVGFRDLELGGGWCIKEIAISMVHAAWTQSMESIIFD